MKTLAVIFMLASVIAADEPAVDLEALRAECRDLYRAKAYREVAAQIGPTREARGDTELQIGLAMARLHSGAISAGRTGLERVLRRHPDQWVVANNLGVIYYRQKNYARSLLQFAAALKVQPDSPVVYDNLVETVHAYDQDDPPERPPRRIAAALQAFEAREAELTKAKAAQGLVRWGTEWIPTEKRTELEKQRIETELEIEKLENQLGYARFDLAKAQAQADRYRRKLRGTFGTNPATGVKHKDQLALAEKDIRTYEEKIRLTERRLETLRAQIPVEPFLEECRMIEIWEEQAASGPPTEPAAPEQVGKAESPPSE